jgi:Flp pilus assembly protein TadB
VNPRLFLVFGAVLWAGVALLLSQLRWFSRVAMADRLRPYAAGSSWERASVLSGGSLRELIGPLSQSIGKRVARFVGVSEDLELRLRRIHASVDANAFRTRQVGLGLAGLGSGALVAVALRPPPAFATVFLLGAPLLAFLVEEQRLSSASARWQRSLFLELPVIAEQIALLLAAGWSLTSALNRIAARGSGVAARDLERVCRRVRHGVPEVVALREWAQVAQVPALDRFVSVLALNRDTSDLGRLIAEDARAIRRDVHRELIEAAERRDQQVWIPVTVATLVPGVLFMAIPFVEALRLFGG